MGPISLDFDASWQDIAHCIKASQRRCRSGLVVDEIKVAKAVTAAVARLQLVAQTLGVKIEDLTPVGVWTDTLDRSAGMVTHVRIGWYGLQVRREALSSTEVPGNLRITIPQVQP